MKKGKGLTLQASCQIGLEFFEFLKETHRASINDKKNLKDIYNTEFRTRNKDLKDPNFSAILYALRSSNKAQIYSGRVKFNPKVKALYQDQWHVPRDQKPVSVQNMERGPGLSPEKASTSPGQASTSPGNASMSPGQASTSSGQASASPGEAETGVRARRRLASLLMNKLKSDVAKFISDKHGVGITSDHELKDGKVCMRAEDVDECVMHLYVKNTGTESVYFTYYSPLHWLKYFTLKDQHKVTRANPLTLAPGAIYEIQVLFRSSLVGFYPATLAFEFKLDLLPTSAAFHIVRHIEAQRVIASLWKELAPKAPYKPRMLIDQAVQVPCNTIVDGQRPEGLSVVRHKNVVFLESYNVPDDMSYLVQTLKYPSPRNTSPRKTLLESPLSSKNYSQRFQLLLYLEELQMEVDIKKYNIPNSDGQYAPMVRDKSNKKLLVLEVPGVSENRPSVLRGDALLAYPEGNASVKYRGYVHSVELEKVKLGFSSELLGRFIDGMRFGIEFTVHRLTMRIQHRAVQLMSRHGLGEVLFPTGTTSSNPTELPSLSLFDRQLEQNPEQYLAVQHIVAGSSKPAPYLVFGPPGTGKTVTVVEAIKQIEKTQGSSCHILACAPSNSATDLLCKKILGHVEERRVFRLYASSRNPRDVPAELQACSNLEGDAYVFPAKEELMQHKIIVTTLLTASRLVTSGVPPGHFTHVFVDEAGHAVESECIIPLAGLLLARSGQVVLAGDPMQLGPIVRSPLALKYGMGVSLLERLMTSEDLHLYQKKEGTYDSRFVTKLLRNYRSHPAILKIPNELFYKKELLVFANEIIRNSYCKWEHLPKKNKACPVTFHAVVGLDEREESSPSFFNIAEVAVLMDYLRKLFETQGKKGLATISPRDIGIIAPYRKQVQKIRKALEKLEKELKVNMNHLKVGSVEEFQGEERTVILVSTVRSSPKYTEIDQKFTLGFVKNQKRFNVAVTRAKALLIVVGNPRVLNTDPTWARFIQYCVDEGGYTGFSHTEEEDEVVARMAALFIRMEPQVE